MSAPETESNVFTAEWLSTETTSSSTLTSLSVTTESIVSTTETLPTETTSSSTLTSLLAAITESIVSTTESLPTETTSSSSTVVIVTQTEIDANTSAISTSRITLPSPTSRSTYNASTTSSTSSQAKSAGLSVGASVGTGIGVALGVLLLALAAFLLYRYKWKRRTFGQEDNGRNNVLPELPELGTDGQKHELAGDRPKNPQTQWHAHELE